MKYKDIVTESLKLMNVTYDMDIAEVSYDDLVHDENIGGYIAGMRGAVNRCFSEIENWGVLPTKSYPIEQNDLLASGNLVYFDTNKIEDFFKVERIVITGAFTYNVDVDFWFEGDNLVLDKLASGNKYVIIYKPKIPVITEITPLDWEIPIRKDIARYIPYFVKGDLYREDEPSEANQSMNFFDQSMRTLSNTQGHRQTQVESVFNMQEMC